MDTSLLRDDINRRVYVFVLVVHNKQDLQIDDYSQANQIWEQSAQSEGVIGYVHVCMCELGRICLSG